MALLVVKFDLLVDFLDPHRGFSAQVLRMGQERGDRGNIIEPSDEQEGGHNQEQRGSDPPIVATNVPDKGSNGMTKKVSN